MEVIFQPRLDYGRGDTTIELDSNGAMASLDGARLAFRA
jgi:hypothetical protein